MGFPSAPATLLSAQHPVGAWGYRTQSPSTELTALCLLALRACGNNSAGVRSGEDWLRSIQRSDGGWPPYPNVEQSTWLTALAVMALGKEAAPARERGISWIVGQTGKESSFVHRLRLWLLGAKQVVDEDVAGWPWYPDTAAWVAPTSFSILALAENQRRDADARLDERIDEGRRFLLARVCHDGGWNHGSSRALGYDSDSYPETTGLALTALHGFESPEVTAGIAAAKRHLAGCRSLNGLAWLVLGLLSHGESVPSGALDRAPCRDLGDVAMYLLASAAMDGRNVFFS